MTQVPLPKEKREEIIAFYAASQNPDGGCGGNIGHDSHITATHYAVLVLAQLGALDKLNVEAIGKYVAKLQNADVAVV